eukprot:COSAG01_NODE_56467_length_318_cov_0.748858_1_plen_58_part_01
MGMKNGAVRCIAADDFWRGPASVHSHSMIRHVLVIHRHQQQILPTSPAASSRPCFKLL